MPEILLLEQLVIVAELGALSRAAEKLHLTQPALSRSMKKLEEEVGVPLFIRGANSLSLNEPGKVVVEAARIVLEAHKELMEKAAAADRAGKKIMLSSCSPLPARKLLSALQKQYHEFSIAVEIIGSNAMREQLQKGSCHLGIFNGPPCDDALFSQKFLEEQLYLAVPQGHPLAGHASVCFRDLERFEILVNGNSGFWLDICRRHLSEDSLLIQTGVDALGKIIASSNLPFFTTDRMIELGYMEPGRIPIPIADLEAHVEYYVACLHTEKSKYEALFKEVEITR